MAGRGGPGLPRRRPRLRRPTPSSALVLLRWSTTGTGDHWCLQRLGALYALLVGVVAGLGAWSASARKPARAAIEAVPLAPLALPAFSRFFVSTYGEPAGLLGTVAVGCGLAAVLATRREDRAARLAALGLVAVGGLVAGTAKVAYLPVLAAAVLICVVTVIGHCRWRLAGPLAAAAVLAAAVAPIGVALTRQDSAYEAVNAHNVLFTMAAVELGPEAFGDLGLPPQAYDLIGDGYYLDPPSALPWWRVAVGDDPGAAQARTYAALARHPAAAARAVEVGLQATLRADLAYLPSAPASLGRPLVGRTLDWSGAQQPQLGMLLGRTGPAWLPSTVAVSGLLAGVSAPVLRRRAAASARWALAAGTASATALGLVTVAVAGDGYFEIFKHVWLAAYLLAVTVLCLAGAVLAPTVRVRAPTQAAVSIG